MEELNINNYCPYLQEQCEDECCVVGDTCHIISSLKVAEDCDE